MHSGARAAGLCLRERFVGDGALSFWPPGARCTFGEPAIQDTVIDPRLVTAALSTLLILGTAAIATGPRKDGADQAQEGRGVGLHGRLGN
jgi:hypothetical protein